MCLLTNKLTVAQMKYVYLGLTETFVYQYLSKLSRFRVIFLADELANLELFPFSNLYSHSNLRRYSWGWFFDKSYKKLFKRQWYFEGVIKKEKVRLIHAHFGNHGVSMLRIKKRLNLPLITTFYGVDISKFPRQKYWQIAYKKLFKEGELFLVEGNFMKKTLINLGCPIEKIIIQHIAIDINKFKQRNYKEEDKNGKFIILFCGRFIEKKGLIYGLKAIKSLVNEYPAIEFRVIGDGNQRAEIENFIKDQGLRRNVILLGYQPYNIFIDELSKARVLLQPSVTAQDGDSEGGAPTVLLEAQASGVPVVSTYHADIPEVVRDGKSGFLVPERDPEKITEKLKILINDLELSKEMGKNGIAHIEKEYNVDIEVKKLEDIYQKIIERKLS